MIRKLWHWSMLLFLFASLPALACNLFSGNDSPPVEVGDGDEVDPGSGEELATAVPRATVPAGEDANGPDEGPALPEIRALDDALAQFGSYRIQVDMRFSDSADSTQSGTMTMNTARVLEPPASSVELSFSGALAEEAEGIGEGATLSFIEIGGSSYSLIPGLGCISGAGGADMANEFDDVLDADELLNELENAEYVGEEMVNGIATYHYRIDESSLSNTGGDFQDATGDLYISQEQQYVVRMVVDGTGNVDVLGENVPDGNIHLELNVLDVGQPITIEVPAECEAAASEYPVMEGASSLATIAGLTTYSVDATLEEAVNFYREEMAARGYTASEDAFITEDTALITFSAEGQPTVSVTLNAEGDTVSVVIAAEGG